MNMTLKQFRDIAIIKTGIEGNRLFPEPRLNFMVNKALKFVQMQLNGLGYKRWETSKTYTTGGTGVVSTVTINNGGGTYAIGDFISLSAGNNDCVLQVLTVNAGVVTGVQIVGGGTGYSVANGISTTSNGSGTGFKANVTAITSASHLTSAAFGSASVLQAPTPSDMLESSSSIIMLDVTDGIARGTTKLEYNPGQFESALGNSYNAPTIKGSGYMRLANLIYFFPATITTAICYYYKTMVDLVGDTDTSIMPVEFEDFVVQKFVNDIKFDLGEIKDSFGADQSISNAITNAYQKAVGTMQQRGDAMKQRDNEVVQ